MDAGAQQGKSSLMVARNLLTRKLAPPQTHAQSPKRFLPPVVPVDGY
jgi:hypothetical protein